MGNAQVMCGYVWTWLAGCFIKRQRLLAAFLVSSVQGTFGAFVDLALRILDQGEASNRHAQDKGALPAFYLLTGWAIFIARAAQFAQTQGQFIPQVDLCLSQFSREQFPQLEEAEVRGTKPISIRQPLGR